MLRGNPWFGDIFEGLRTEIRVLILADGDITFVESKFGLTELINEALQPRAMTWEELKITTAHRSQNGKGAEPPGFRLTEKTFNNDLYHRVWLFGHNGELRDDNTCEMEFVQSIEDTKAPGLVFVEDIDEDAREQLQDQGIHAITLEEILGVVSIWDWHKQNAAVLGMLHFLAHIEQNPNGFYVSTRSSKARSLFK